MMSEKSIESTIDSQSDLEIAEMSLLIIEDDDDQILQLSDYIEHYNHKQSKSEKLRIETEIVRSYEESLHKLLIGDYDAAIVDLKLDNTSPEDAGVKLIEIIIAKLRFPIYIRTGFPEKIIDISTDHFFVDVYKKTDPIQDIINKMVKFHKKGLTETIGTKGKVEKYLNEIFWNKLSQNIIEWDRELLENQEYETSLVRYSLTLLQEYLDFNENEEFTDYHPFEVFIKPPIKTDYFFGDILLNNEVYYIILSPACDMAQKKYEKIIVAEIDLLENIDEINDIKRRFHENNIEDGSKNKTRKAIEAIKKYLKNNHSDKYHFLPGFQDFPGGLINFQKINSFFYEDLKNMDDRFATVSERFAKDITARFSHYISRQGQPDLNINVLLSGLEMESIHDN